MLSLLAAQYTGEQPVLSQRLTSAPDSSSISKHSSLGSSWNNSTVSALHPSLFLLFISAPVFNSFVMRLPDRTVPLCEVQYFHPRQRRSHQLLLQVAD